MNEQTPPTKGPDPSRNKLIVGGGVIAVVCTLVGYQLGSNNHEDSLSSQRFGTRQGQMMPPGQGQFQGPQGQGGQNWQQGPGQRGQGDDDDSDRQGSGPPMSGAS